MNSVMVTGGAGFIGSHACKQLAAAGYLPVVHDNLSRGNEKAVAWGSPAVGDIRDRNAPRQAIDAHEPRAIAHFAALAYVGKSVAEPSRATYGSRHAAREACIAWRGRHHQTPARKTGGRPCE